VSVAPESKKTTIRSQGTQAKSLCHANFTDSELAEVRGVAQRSRRIFFRPESSVTLWGVGEVQKNKDRAERVGAVFNAMRLC
jgi:hypothetical protein